MGSWKYRNPLYSLLHLWSLIPVLAARPGGQVHRAEDSHYQLQPRPVIPGLHLEAAPEVTRRRARPREVSLDCEEAWLMTSSGWWDMAVTVTIRRRGRFKTPLSLWRLANFTHNPAPASPFKMRFRNMIFDLKKATPLLLTATLRTEKLFLVQWAGSICDQGNSNTISPPPKYHHDHHPDDVFPERDLSPE